MECSRRNVHVVVHMVSPHGCPHGHEKYIKQGFP